MGTIRSKMGGDGILGQMGVRRMGTNGADSRDKAALTVAEPMPRSADANALAQELASLCGCLTANQREYLAALCQSGSVKAASQRVRLSAVSVRAWRRRTPGFREAEQRAQDAAGDFGAMLARSMVGAAGPQAAARVLSEIDDANHSRDRSSASRVVLDRVYPLPQASPALQPHEQAGLTLLAALRQSFAPVVAVAPVASITEVPSGTTATTSEMEATSGSYDGGD